MAAVRPLPARKVLRALTRLGFVVVRTRGSHVFLRHPDGRATVVPVHPGEDVGRGLVRKIIRDAGVEAEAFLEHV